jgi:hypothetical protein
VHVLQVGVTPGDAAEAKLEQHTDNRKAIAMILTAFFMGISLKFQ